MRRRATFATLVALAAVAGAALPAGAGSHAPRVLLYTSVWGDNYVSVSDGRSMRELAQLPALADGPAVLEATPDQRKIYLENGGPDARTIGVIDTLAMRQTRQVEMSGVQGDRATRIQRDGRFYYYSSIPDGDVTQVDTSTDTVSRIYKGLGNDFTVSTDGRTLFAYGSSAVTAVDVASGKTVGTVSLPTSTNVPLVQGGFGWTMVSRDGSQLIHVANPTVFVDIRRPTAMRLITTVAVGTNPVLADLSPDGRWIWVPNAGDGTISVLDVLHHKVVRTLTTGRYMTYSTFDPTSSRVYVAQARAGGPPPTPVTVLALYFGQMGGSGLITSRSGQYYSRPGLDTPGEVVAYDARTFQLAKVPAVKTATVPSFLLAVSPR
jgi:DNA-binding beta-propeller fold protein YncE